MPIEQLTNTETQRQEIIHVQPIKVELERLASGKYKWTAHVYAESVEQALQTLSDVDQAMRKEYLETPKEE